MTLRSELQEILFNRNVQAFLRVIRAGESSQKDDAYRTQVGGKLLDSLAAHPREKIYVPSLKLWSTAAGAYQHLMGTWDECAKALDLTDFSKESQDLAALFLIRRRGAMPDVLAGRLHAAVAKCAKEWASLPGSPYGQPVRTMSQVLATYALYGGSLTGTGGDTAPAPLPEPPPSAAPDPQPKPGGFKMPAFLLAAIPALLNLIPDLVSIFGSGKERSQKNLRAVAAVVDVAKTAIGAANEQELIEKIEADPEAALLVKKAVQSHWFELKEMGGGVSSAREADTIRMTTGVPFYKSAAFAVTMAFMPVIYATIVAVLFGGSFSDDLKAMVVGAVVGGLMTGAVSTYWLGTSSSSARKTEIMSQSGEKPLF